MQYDFNGVTIELKDRVCRLWNYIPGEINPQINLYIRATNICNANCKFCEYHGDKTEFNWETFEVVLNDLKERNILCKIQITGGEPSIIEDKLQRMCETIRQYFPDNFIGINSNGHNILSLVSINSLINNYSISRHHYDDEVNYKIFGTKSIPNSDELREFIKTVGDDKVHLSCNLMKNGISNSEEMKKYLEFCSSIGCKDVGFVTLMDANEFCKNEQVIFDSTGVDESEDFLKYKQYTKDCNKCRCANYLYHCKNTNSLIDVYGRFVTDKDNTPGILSFDGQHLRYGFSGSILI